LNHRAEYLGQGRVVWTLSHKDKHTNTYRPHKPDKNVVPLNFLL